LNLEYNKDVFELFSAIDERLWKQQKEELQSVADVLDIRFAELSETIGLIYDSKLAKEHFGNLLGEQYMMAASIKEVLKNISAYYKIYAAPKRMLTMQKNRLQHSSLKRYFTDLYVSDDIGSAKPYIRFFTESMKRAGLEPSDILMIGDSLVSDIT